MTNVYIADRGFVNLTTANSREFVPKKRSLLASGKVPQVLILLQIVCQLVLLSGAGSVAEIRPVVRTAAFAASLVLLLFVGRTHGLKNYPSTIPAMIALIIVGMSIFRPDTDSFLAGTAHAALYLAILSPLFWVPRLTLTSRDLRNLFLVIWIYYSLSSALGVLQFAYPGRFQPALSSAITDRPVDYIEGLMIQTSEGEMVYRPMGLTDNPGGAAVAGFYAVLIGVGLFLTTRSVIAKLLCVGSMALGMACLYICQVRSVLIMALVCLIVLFAILVRRGRIVQTAFLLAAAVFVIGGGFLLAYKLGGETITDRLFTLTDQSLTDVYYQNRGIFLEYTINDLLPQIPWGAGLGHWGMMNNYFGNPASSIYVEIQWTGWLIDGGIPLVLAYSVALLSAVWFAWKAAMSKNEKLWVWGAVLLAYDIAACASTFNYPFFMSQSGLELWLVNAALFAASQVQATPSLVDDSPALLRAA